MEGGPQGHEEVIVALIHGARRELWLLALGFFVVGDLVTTVVGLQGGGVAEVGPVVGPLIETHGLAVMLPLKLLALGVCYLVWRATPDPQSVGVPLGLAVLGILVTGWNLAVIGMASLTV